MEGAKASSWDTLFVSIVKKKYTGKAWLVLQLATGSGGSVNHRPYSLGFDKERPSNYIDLLSVNFHLSEKA
jgi:hypothetical protein